MQDQNIKDGNLNHFQNFYNIGQVMKLTLKTLKGQIFTIDAEPQTTIAQVKAKVKEQKGLDAELQKIVYKGKPVIDTETVEALGIKEGEFIVLMNLVKKPESKPKQQTSEKQEKKEQKKQQKPKPSDVKKESGPASVPLPAVNEAKISELMTMGFDREKCVTALRASFGNSDVAVDYLLNGIPADIGQPGPENVEEVLRALVASPQFAPFKEMIRSDPNSLAPALEQISATSPALYSMIVENPDTFQKVITEQYGGDYDDEDDEDEGLDEEGEDLGQEGSIAITQEEDAAIKRLMALGFSQIDAAQAYFACDKNQQLAANLLFDRMANGDLDQGGLGGNQGGNQGHGHGDDDDDNLFQ